MKNEEKDELILLNIERNPLFLLFLALFAGLFFWGGWQLLKDVNPLGLLVLFPGAAIGFQCLWLVLHPFALFYENRVDIRQSFLHRKERYFVDIKQVVRKKNGKIFLVYNDDEIEKLNLFGIRQSHTDLILAQMEKMVSESVKQRS